MQEAWRQNPGSPLYWEDRKRAFALIREMESSYDDMYAYYDALERISKDITATGILIAHIGKGPAKCYLERAQQFMDDIWNEPENWRRNGEKLWSNSAENKVVSYFEGEASCGVGVYRREKDGKPCWAVAVRHSYSDDRHDEFNDYVIGVDSAEEGIKLAEEMFTDLSSRVNSLMEAVDERGQAYEDRLIAEAEHNHAKG